MVELLNISDYSLNASNQIVTLPEFVPLTVFQCNQFILEGVRHVNNEPTIIIMFMSLIALVSLHPKTPNNYTHLLTGIIFLIGFLFFLYKVVFWWRFG